MIATAPPPVVNRIAGYGPVTPPPVPASPEGRQAAWSDALFAAVLFYQSRLTHPDPEVAERAARAIFDLEKTRLRHGREMAGTPAEKPEDTPRSGGDARQGMPTKADVERLGQIAKLAMQVDEFDALNDEDDEFEEFDFASLPTPKTEEEAVEAYAKTPMFASIVQLARNELVRDGQNATESNVVKHAKQMLLSNLRRACGKPEPTSDGPPRSHAVRK